MFRELNRKENMQLNQKSDIVCCSLVVVYYTTPFENLIDKYVRVTKFFYCSLCTEFKIQTQVEQKNEI